MRDYIWLLLVVLASVQAQYYYPQPSPPFGLPEPVDPAPAQPTQAPTLAPATQPPPPPPTVAPVVEEYTTPSPPPATTAAPTAAPTTLPPPPPPTTAAATTTYAPPPPPPTTTEPPPPPPTTTEPPPAVEYLPPVTTVPPPPPTTTLPPPPPPTTTLPPPPPPTTALPTTTYAPPPPTTTLPPQTTTLPPPPSPTTTYAPPPLEYLPPVTARPVVVPTENPLFPDANENQQVSVLFPTAAPTTTTTTPAPVVVVTTPRPAPPPVQPVLTESEEEIAFWDFRESIPGEPELDYPIFDKIPVTAFTCDDKIDGYYADVEARCQVFHVCTAIPDQKSIKNSFLCPNGTIFNQENFACQWWPDVECASSSDFFSLNENIGKVPERPANEEQQVVIAAAAPVAVIAPAPEPVRTAEPAAVVVPLPNVILPVVQAQASAFSESVAEPVFATAVAAVVIPAQLDVVDIPAPAVEIAYEPAAAAAPEVQAVLIPELIAPVEIPAPEVISIRDEPVQEVIQSALPQAPSGLYEAPDTSSSGAQYKY